jgi:hypothetical protein
VYKGKAYTLVVPSEGLKTSTVRWIEPKLTLTLSLVPPAELPVR